MTRGSRSWLLVELTCLVACVGGAVGYWRTLPIQVALQPDQRTVEARRGPIRLWSVDVVAACEAQGGTVCDGIDPRVRHFAIDGAEASFVYGKHSYGLIDVESGEVSYWGSD